MTTENIKSAAITDFDAVPPIAHSAGLGSPGILRSVNGSASVTSGVAATSTYQLARIPSMACVKAVKLWLDAGSTTITGDIGLYYSSSLTDGTPAVDAPAAGVPVAVNTTGGSQLFGTAVALAAIVEPTDFSGESGTYVGAKRVQPAWQACGLTKDPGGFFDLVFTLTSTAGAAAVVNGQVDFV